MKFFRFFFNYSIFASQSITFMNIKYLSGLDLITNKWVGGTTTQLYIYPEYADYKERNFQFRISTATVETEESTFTQLPGVSRKLMILDGEIRIEHTNHHSKILKKFEQDEFSGNWETKSFGKATDFNVMTTGNTYGEIKAITLQKGEQCEFEDLKNFDFLILYAYSGSFKCKTEKKTYSVEKGDLLIIDAERSTLSFIIESMDHAEIIITRLLIKK